MFRGFSVPVLCLTLCIAIVACALPGRAPDRLYRDLGERPGIEALIDAFLIELADDDRIVAHFADANIPRLRGHLIDQVCQLAGGPCRYTGDDMALVHAGMDLSHADFNALVEDLIQAMYDQGISTRTQNRLLALLAPMHPDIVHK